MYVILHNYNMRSFDYFPCHIVEISRLALQTAKHENADNKPLFGW